MKINHSDFITSAADPKGYPVHDLPEIAFLGRSNVGKSSLINAFLGRKRLAKVSSTPGKTTLINFFDVNSVFSLVDLPGYGYAKRSKTELAKWGIMIEEYLSQRENLVLFLLLLDVRRVPNQQDIEILSWLSRIDCSHAIILTKCDKLNQKERNKQIRLISDKLDISSEFLVKTSAFKRQGLDRLHRLIEDVLVFDEAEGALTQEDDGIEEIERDQD